MEHPTRIGKYDIEQFLGGGMSHVYKARDRVLGRRVAVKVLTEAGMSDNESKARFLLEARTASNMSHENIISVYDFGEEQGRPFIVMEFLEGESLKDAIKNAHTGDLNSKLRIACQIGKALDYIHSRKIVHRDIKPDNINIDAFGKVKLMDFGIAKAEGVQLTRAGFTLGTPYYMSPEQVLGRPVTPQADVYAFGVLLFELLAGIKPVAGASVDKIFHQILYEPLDQEPLRSRHIPDAVREVVVWCTGKQLSDRAPNLKVVVDELEWIIDPSRTKPPRPSAPVAVTGAATIPAAPPVEASSPKTQRPQDPPKPIPPPRTEPPRPTVRKEAASDMPGFLNILPSGLRTQAGLMVLTGVVVLLLMAILYTVLSMTHVV